MSCKGIDLALKKRRKRTEKKSFTYLRLMSFHIQGFRRVAKVTCKKWTSLEAIKKIRNVNISIKCVYNAQYV
jgi:hypothetical protein